ncbi:MAG: ATP-binding cassette domain-containing protein [Desulfosarcinaceae bacterium]
MLSSEHEVGVKTMEQPLIEVRDLSKSFDGRTVLEGVNLKLHKGEVISIIGKSGVGKSVLLKHIIGLLDPDSGQVLFNGQPIDQMNAKQKGDYLGRISYMFQNNALFNALTVRENVAMPLRYKRGIKRKEIDEKVMQRLDQMELREAAEKYPGEISGGMQKRVAMARALISEPDIVLFDEPTTGQDPIRKNAILSMISAYQQKYNFSAILISHDLPDVFFVSNTILALYDGRIIFDGPPEDFDSFDHPFRSEFIHSLEQLQKELGGFYSQRQFKVRYHTDLYQNPSDTAYSVVIFNLEHFPAIAEKLGHQASQELLMATGAFINKHFSTMGGFSTRSSMDQFITVLPFADMDEAWRLVKDFGQDLSTNGIASLQRVMPAPPECEHPVDIILSAGVAQGKPQTDLESVIDSARVHQDSFMRFKVKCREKTNEKI